MNNRFYYFLLVAEELNMSRAAERAYISHQGISNTVKLLEQEYGVPLFYRSPRLSLTPAGETLVRALKQIKLIEDNLAAELSEDHSEFRGKITLGVPLSRYDVLVPDLVPPFKKQFPKVELEIISDYSETLEQLAINNELDLCISTGQTKSPDLTTIELMKEYFVLLVSNQLLRDNFGEHYQELIGDFQQGVHLKGFENIPFIQYPPSSRLRHALLLYAEDNDIHLKPVFESNHAMSFGSLVQKNLGMGVVSRLFIPSIAKLNFNCGPMEYVHAFPLYDLPYCKTLSLVYHHKRYLGKLHKMFIELVINTFSNYQNCLPDYL